MQRSTRLTFILLSLSAALRRQMSLIAPARSSVFPLGHAGNDGPVGSLYSHNLDVIFLCLPVIPPPELHLWCCKCSLWQDVYVFNVRPRTGIYEMVMMMDGNDVEEAGRELLDK